MPSLMAKRAGDPLGGSDKGFEQSMSELAHMVIRDKIPDLLDMEIGFELIDRDEDSNRAVAIMGFDIGGTLGYIPFFWTNNRLKGYDMIYLPQRDKFIPAKEAWLNEIYSRKINRMGSEVERRGFMPATPAPDYDMFTRSPKRGSAADDLLADVAPKMRPLVIGFAKVACAQLDNKPSPLMQYLSNGGKERVIKFAQLLVDEPMLALGFDDFYKLEDLKKAAEATRLSFTKKASAVDNLFDPPGRPYHHFVPRPVYIPVSVGMQKAASYLTPEEKEAFLRGEPAIRDKRAADETTVAFVVQEPTVIQSPKCSGMHTVILAGAETEKCAIFANPWGKYGPSNNFLIIREGKKGHVIEHPTKIFLKDPSTTDAKGDLQAWAKSLDTAKTLPTEGGKYALVHENGTAIGPFSVEKKVNDHTYEVWFDYCLRYEDPDHSAPYGRFEHRRTGPCARKIVFTDKDGSKPVQHSEDLLVPNGYRLLKIRPAYRRSDALEDGDDASSSEWDEIRLGGDYDTWETAIARKWPDQVKVASNSEGKQFELTSSLGSRVLDKPEAHRYLVCNLGLSKEAATEMLQARDTEKSYFVKYAVGYPWGQDVPVTPEIPAPLEYLDPANQYTGATATGPDRTYTPLEGFSTPSPPPEGVMDPPYNMSWTSNNYGVPAKKFKSKDVFDASGLQSMIRTNSEDRLFNEDIPVLEESLDQLYRKLFNYYAHYSQYEERYGRKDTPELEDLLRSTADNMGDLIVFLKMNRVGGGPEDMSGFVDISMAGN